MNSIVYVVMDVHKEQYTLCCYSYDTDKVEYKQIQYLKLDGEKIRFEDIYHIEIKSVGIKNAKAYS